MIDKNIVLGSAAAILAVVGIWYAVKNQSAASASSGAATSQYGMPIYSSIGASGGVSGGAISSGSSIDASQVGDIATLLAQQNEISTLQANANYSIGVINATSDAANPFLARTSDMNGRGGDYLLYDPVTTTTMGAGGAGGSTTVSANQRIVAGGPQTMTLDYVGTNTFPTANGTTTTAPVQSQFTAHLTETLPSLRAAPAPGVSNSVFIPQAQAAPAPVIQSGGGCFITTAVCEEFGLPDDNDALETLRKFRDEYMLTDEKRRENVHDYYQVAPHILARIDAYGAGLRRAILGVLRDVYIFPAVMFVKKGEYAEAMRVYTRMVSCARNLSGM